MPCLNKKSATSLALTQRGFQIDRYVVTVVLERETVSVGKFGEGKTDNREINKALGWVENQGWVLTWLEKSNPMMRGEKPYTGQEGRETTRCHMKPVFVFYCSDMRWK